MKKMILAALLAASFPALADQYVNGYTRKDGTYVQPHYRTDANDTKLDNYSTRGNTNPYTGQAGTKDPYDSGSSYGQSRRSTPCYGLGCKDD